VEARQFREDLYHRLNVVYLHMPTLRERSGDIPILANHFLERYSRQHRPGSTMRLTDRAMQKLMSYSWPGNIRELESVVQRSIILVSRELLCAEDIDLPGVADPPAEAKGLGMAKSKAIGEFERNYLMRVLEQCGGNVTRAARSAGKDRRTFQRLLQKYNVERRTFSATA